MDPEGAMDSCVNDVLMFPGSSKVDFVDVRLIGSRVQKKNRESAMKRNRPIHRNIPASPSLKVYPMNRTSRGKVLIFNHVQFDNEVYPERIGTNNDVERLHETLLLLGFLKKDILDYKDYTFDEIQRTAIKLRSDEDLHNSDCLIVVILTNGGDGDLLMARDREYHLYSFIQNFIPTKLTSMAGKPKLFIVQACRDEKSDRDRTPNSMDHVDPQTKFFNYPKFADLLIAMSSHQGHYSFRNEKGSWMIQELCNVIEDIDVDSASIYDIITETSNAVAKRVLANGSSQKKKQIPCFYSTLTKRLYFKSSR